MQADGNGTIDASTVYWWLSQSKEAINSITADPKLPLREALEQLNVFLRKADCVWSHATFDFVIISNALKRLGIKPKFHYRSARDIRTLVDLSDVSVSARPQVGIAHDALDDCIYQVAYCVEALKTLKGRIE